MKPTSGYVALTARRNAGPPTCAAGNTFTTRRPSDARALDLGGGRDPREERQPELVAHPHDLLVRPRRDGKRRTGVVGGAGLLGREHRPGADEQPVDLAREANRLGRARMTERDLDAADPAREQRCTDLRRARRILDRGDRHDATGPEAVDHCSIGSGRIHPRQTLSRSVIDGG